jgi:tetrahydromethanopterin S-methyltransferase subunit B
VSYTLLDSQDFIDDMRTGIYAVDLFLKSVNPDKARAKARVFTPDIPRARRYNPKALKLGLSDLDVSVPVDGDKTIEVTLESINAGFLADEIGWTPYLVLRNYAETFSTTITDSVVISDPTPAAKSVSNKSLTSNVATLTTSTAHGIAVGSAIVVAGVDATFNGSYTVIATPTTTTLTYAKINANIVSAVATGTVTAPTDDVLALTITYEEARKAIGLVDPGTYDLYASRTNGEETEIIYIGSGNLVVKLSEDTATAYTLG